MIYRMDRGSDVVRNRQRRSWMEILKERSESGAPAVGKCACGRRVLLAGFTNTCECGRDYNMNGTLLAPRSQWGEETGESVSDILRVDSMCPSRVWEDDI
jgi:hypothetical protein